MTDTRTNPLADGSTKPYPRTELQKKVWRMRYEKGMRPFEIARRLGVSQARIHYILNPEKKATYDKEYRKTPKGQQVYKECLAAYRERNRYELKLMQHMGCTMAEARKIVRDMSET